MRNMVIIFVLYCLTNSVEATDRNLNAVIVGVTAYQGTYEAKDLKSFKLDKAACDMKKSVAKIADNLGITEEKNIKLEVFIDSDECEKKGAPTDELIIESLTRQLQDGLKNDVFVFYFTGHGVDSSILTSGHNPSGTKRNNNLIRLSYINDIIRSSHYKGHILMFFDMCRVQGSKTDGNFEEFDFKAKLNSLQDWNVWYASSFPAPAYIDNKGKTQELIFGEQTDYGYFTKYIVNLLNQTDVLVIEEALKNNGKNGCIDTRELSEYIHDNVKKEVSAESSGKQIPTVSAISRSNNQFCIISNSNKISMEVESSTKQPITEAIKDIIEYGALRNDRNFYCDTEAINYIRFTFGNLGNELRNQGTASLSLLLDYKRQIFSAFAYLISSFHRKLI